MQDLGALSQEQQSKLNKFKIQTRVENEKYLREHPEVESLMGGFLSDVLTKRPDNIQEFAAKYFIQPDVNSVVEKSLEDRQNNMKQNSLLQKTG
ncbi:hypothetical protein LOTGIDRAFT_109278 [Lottia gigantea]|uniref:RIIa domain-containing protein n=1 Tax=Lottia gigantea TaxID=225164 RepID=V4B389_LOTGI|nr:hypothetical protein LOTGIDRAFT_109278 [Lottia gigantea]ESP04803.1 hypothetical protein LOTGIDRAFT_109278 [Lottia gigantea]